MTKNIHKIMSIKFILIIFLTLGNLQIFAEGTKEVMPSESHGTALWVSPNRYAGSYRGSDDKNRIYFSIDDHNNETFYFGFNKRMRIPSSGVPNDVYYRIMSPSGAEVVGPTSVSSSGTGFISSYARALVGPNIGSTTSGYDPYTYDPKINGDFYLEIYRSNDAGATAVTSTSGEVFFIYFDFTVGDSNNNKLEGRVFSKKWSFITYNPNNYAPSINYDFRGSYYGYTADSMVNKVSFEPGFRPYGFNLQMNYEGIGDSGDFEDDRKSINSGANPPTIANGYKVFLNIPDQNVFETANVSDQPVVTGNIYGCPGDYFIPYYIDNAGDVAILLDLNGTLGYQPNTSDIVLEEFGQSGGNHVMAWDGNDGLGNPVSTGVSVSITADIYRGRTNVPVYDAELNINGLTINSIYPNTGNRELYWDDASLTSVSGCGNNGMDDIANSNGSGVAITNIYDGILGPTHAWNGSNPTTSAPASSGSSGSSTNTLCDDFGNARTINTWFWASNVASVPVTKTVPTCNTGGGQSYIEDLDDDDDGISDLEESGGVDPNADEDGDGIPNYIDPSYPAFKDINFDGINDNFDADLDGLINSVDLDSDNDGLRDILEAGGIDTDNDGEVDGFTDANNNGIHDIYDIACDGGTTTLYASSVEASGGSGIVNPNNITGTNDNISARVTMNNDYIIVNLGLVVSDGIIITFRWRAIESGSAIMNVYAGLTTNTNTTQSCPTTSSSSLINSSLTLDGDAQYIKISKGTNSCGTGNSIVDYEVDAISFTQTVPCTGGIAIPNIDTDGDAISNAYDLDSDNDGIADIVEAGGVDTNGDGFIDDKTDTDGDGIQDDYDVYCVGGLINRYAQSVIIATGSNDLQNSSSNALNVEDDNSANIYINDDVLILDMGFEIASGTDIIIRWRERSNQNGTAIMNLWAGNNTNPTTIQTCPMTNSTSYFNETVTLNTSARYIKISKNASSCGTASATDFEIDAVWYVYNSPCVIGDEIANLDTDGDGIMNYLDLDSDNDGIPDVIEAGGTDANNDGKIDGFTDTDNDGFAQSVDGSTDNYGTADNTDNALIITDADENNDGVPENYLRANNDGNGLPNPYDLDADGDGIVDTREAGITDTDNNGIADAIGPLGIDGWLDDVDFMGNLALANSDGYGNPDYLDIDSDDDGIVDNIEGQSTLGYAGLSGEDSDNDGIDNVYDNSDASFGGNEDNGIVPVNTDGADQPDYADKDADNDGFLDVLEGWDANGDGEINNKEIAFVGTTDTDGDGLFDEYDNDDTKIDPTNGTVPGTYPDAVSEGEDRDWREGATSLPVELYSQGVELVNANAVIDWTTATETNNDYFVIERSQNGVDFNEIGIVEGAGNSNILLSYELIDVNPLEGVSYYRITQFDFDGKSETFPIMVLNVESSITELNIFPNPAKSYTNIESSIDGELSIISSIGVLVHKTEVLKGQTLKLNTDKFKSGIYIVKIEYADKVEMHKLIVK